MLPTRVDYFNIGADDLATRSAVRPPGQRISPDEVFTDGSDINIVNAGASAMAEEVTRQLGLRIAALFLETAEGEDLDRLVADRFSPAIVRKQASPAVVTLEFSRVTGALLAGVQGAGTRVRTIDGIEFLTRTSASFSAGQVGPVSVVAEAVEAGTAGNVGIDAIAEIVGNRFDGNLTVTNPDVAAGGDDVESDPRLRSRARQFFEQARRGTVGAIEFGALQVEGVRLATAIEVLTEDGRPAGPVELFIADAQGQANAALAAAVTGNLLEFRAAGVFVSVIASVPVFQPIQLLLRFEAGTNSTDAFASVQQGILARVNVLRPRATLEESLILATARAVSGVIVRDDALIDPVGDVVPTSNQVIRTSLDLITAV